MTMPIRQAETRDASAIAGILRELGHFSHINEESVLQTEERIAGLLTRCRENNKHLLYVAECSDGRVVGYAALHLTQYLIHSGPEGYVSELFIKESARGQGIGGALLEHMKQAAQEHGCFRMRLINLNNRESYQRGFYAKQGWKEWPEAVSFIYPL